MSPTNEAVLERLGLDVSVLTGVTQDSRAVEHGFLFAALDGENVRGRDFITDAVARGASHILADEFLDCGAAQCVVSAHARQDFSHIVSAYYAKQPKNIVAVTGTNGKSSVVHFINQMWCALGYQSKSIGTLSGNMTTPDPVALHKTLADYSGQGITHVAMEGSSHGLAQYRMDGTDVTVAAFTSFSQDHLDYHADMDDYLRAKTRLFSDILTPDGVAVLNADIPEYDALSEVCRERGIRVISYGENGCDLALRDCHINGMGQRIDVEIFGKSHVVTLPLIGRFQVMNILCALGCVLAHDMTEENVDVLCRAVERVESVPGRLEHVPSIDGKRHAYVDYAHTPDALENVLKTLRKHTGGRIICVFGCGGDRDRGKRALMGAVASSHADVVIITDDNPRTENPADIRKEIYGGIDDCSNVIEIENRRHAIKSAVEMMRMDDVLLVAGKGHEKYQIIGIDRNFFDDVEEVRIAFGYSK